MGSPAQYPNVEQVGEVPEFAQLWQRIKTHMREIDFQPPEEFGCSENGIWLTDVNKLDAPLMAPDGKPQVFLTRSGELYGRWEENSVPDGWITLSKKRGYLTVGAAMFLLNCKTLRDFFFVLMKAATGNLRHKQSCASDTVTRLSDVRVAIASTSFEESCS